jgi:hypothetical protein
MERRNGQSVYLSECLAPRHFDPPPVDKTTDLATRDLTSLLRLNDVTVEAREMGSVE